MKVFAEGLLFKVAKITGPTHNFLGLEYAYTPTDILFEDMNRKTAGETGNAVRARVLEAFDEVALEKPIEGRFYLKRILFDGEDTPNKDTYKELFIALVEYARNAA